MAQDSSAAVSLRVCAELFAHDWWRKEQLGRWGASGRGAGASLRAVCPAWAGGSGRDTGKDVKDVAVLFTGHFVKDLFFCS